MNKFETAIRRIVELIAMVGATDTWTLVMKLPELIFQIADISEHLNTVPRDQWVGEIRAALDNMIGTEPDALIGPYGSLLKFDSGVIDFEDLTDLILKSAEKYALSQTGGAADTQ